VTCGDAKHGQVELQVDVVADVVLRQQADEFYPRAEVAIVAGSVFQPFEVAPCEVGGGRFQQASQWGRPQAHSVGRGDCQHIAAGGKADACRNALDGDALHRGWFRRSPQGNLACACAQQHLPARRPLKVQHRSLQPIQCDIFASARQVLLEGVQEYGAMSVSNCQAESSVGGLDEC
jgi:hypothetical protein